MNINNTPSPADPHDRPITVQDLYSALQHLKLSSEAVQASLQALAATPTLKRADMALSELNGLSATVQRIRLRLAEVGTTG